MYECVENMKIHVFDIYFFNMDLSLIIALICLKICMYILKMYMEGIVSQIFDIAFSFCLIVCRRWKLEKNTNNHKSYPFFVIK